MDVCVVFVVKTVVWNVTWRTKGFKQYKNGSKGKNPGQEKKIENRNVMCTFPSVYIEQFKSDSGHNLPFIPREERSLHWVCAVSERSVLFLKRSTLLRWDFKACVRRRYIWHTYERSLSIVYSCAFVHSVQASFDFSPVGININWQCIIACQCNVCLFLREYFLGHKGGRCVGLRTLPPSCADCLKICEPQPPGTLRVCSGM
jgi:hypothetical protein